MRKSMKQIKELVSMAYRLDKASILLTFWVSMIRSIKPYIAFALSGYIINQLYEKAAYQTILKIVICSVSLIFVLSLMDYFLDKYRVIHIELCVRQFSMEKGKKTLDMDYELVDSPRMNELRSQMRTDNTWGAGFLTLFYQLFECFSYLFGSLMGLGWLVPLCMKREVLHDKSSLIFMGAFILFVLVVNLWNAKYITKRKNQIMEESTNEISYLDYFLLGQIDYKLGKDIRIYDAEPIIRESLDSGFDRWKNVWTKAFTKIYALEGAMIGMSTGIFQGGAYLFVIIQAIHGVVSVGDAVMYASIIFNFSKNIMSLVDSILKLALTASRQQSTMAYLNVPNKMHSGTKTIEMTARIAYVFEFKNVSFKYPGSERYVLKDINLRLDTRQRMAVVGMNGSGKTTFIKLLCRMYEPTEGEITLNGINIQEYDYEAYMKLFGVVFQDFQLFSFKLGQNISGNVTYDEAKARDAVTRSGLGKRFETMPKGMESNLYKNIEEDGIEISGGEAQKVAMARALYKDAPYIILDEPTAALDPISEYEVFTRFNEIIGDKYAIYISHRLSSCRFCQDILVLDEGRIIQRGNHDKLLEDEQGKYFELWNAQAKHYCV